jgi:phage shock protein PspC (stress-responsive transcriptional regulator)
MKKTLTANISGIVFHIDEDAYEKLSRYLSNVRRHFTAEEGGDEILADIESRIAEMLQEKTTASKQVVTLDDINEVISQLGDPSQFSGEETTAEPAAAFERTQKRLYRDPDNKYLGGVAGGLGAFFNLDPTWLRVAFVVFTFVYGFGPLVYIILWIVVPKARTTAEKLEMRGRKVNISNIEKSIREELHELKKNIENFSEETRENLKKKENRNALENTLAGIGKGIGAFFRVFFKVVGILIGVFFVFLGIFLLVGLLSSLFWGPVPVTFPYGDIHIFSLHALLELLFTSPWIVRLAITGLLLAVGIPLVTLVYAGLRLIFGFESRIRYFGLVAFMLWIAGIALLSFVSVNGVRHFSASQSVVETHSLESASPTHLYLGTDPVMWRQFTGINTYNVPGNWELLWKGNDHQRHGKPRLRIRGTQSPEMQLTVIRESRGPSYLQAREYAQGIDYRFQMQDSSLVLDPVFSFEQDDPWRGQKILLELSVPNDKVVVLSDDLKKALEVRWGNIPNVVDSRR